MGDMKEIKKLDDGIEDSIYDAGLTPENLEICLILFSKINECISVINKINNKGEI